MPDPHISPFHEAVTAPPVDRTVLARISGGDPSTERDILADFRRDNDEDAAALDRAEAATDGAQVTRSAHRMLGASRMVGAPAFASVCETIEHASRRGRLEQDHSQHGAVPSGMEPPQYLPRHRLKGRPSHLWSSGRRQRGAS